MGFIAFCTLGTSGDNRTIYVQKNTAAHFVSCAAAMPALLIRGGSNQYLLGKKSGYAEPVDNWLAEQQSFEQSEINRVQSAVSVHICLRALLRGQ